MARQSDLVTKSKLARELGLSPGRISQLVAQGLPVERDGRVDRAAARAWIAANIDPFRSRVASRAQETERPPAVAAAIGAARAAHAGRAAREGEVARDMIRVAVDQLEQITANLVMDAGGGLKVAWMVAPLMGSCALVVLWGYAQRQGWVPAGEAPGYEPDVGRVAWPRIAELAGEPFDPAELDAYTAERLRLLEVDGTAAEAGDTPGAGRAP